MSSSHKNVGPGDVRRIAQDFAKILSKDEKFIVWLDAPIGAGKTTLVGHILHTLGLAENEPVTSPTYTYMNEFKIKDDWYAHLDFYRARHQEVIEDFGLLDTRDFRGTFIEWADIVTEKSSFVFTHKISISFTDDRAGRNYEIKSLS